MPSAARKRLTGGIRRRLAVDHGILRDRNGFSLSGGVWDWRHRSFLRAIPVSVVPMLINGGSQMMTEEGLQLCLALLVRRRIVAAAAIENGRYR